MNGAHDLGGKHGLGPINPEPESSEPVFHAEWERRVFALTLATGMLGKWNIDESRSARERQHPVAYLSHSYYENWLAGLETLLAEKGLLQLDAGKQFRVPDPDTARQLLAIGGPTAMQATAAARYNIGDLVRVRRMPAVGHTRAPQYAQGVTGTIVQLHGCHVLPDSHAMGVRKGEHLYSVRFDGALLWNDPLSNSTVAIDLWESYLEPVADHA